MRHDDTRDLTPVLPKKLRSDFYTLMTRMLLVGIAFTLIIEWSILHPSHLSSPTSLTAFAQLLCLSSFLIFVLLIESKAHLLNLLINGLLLLGTAGYLTSALCPQLNLPYAPYSIYALAFGSILSLAQQRSSSLNMGPDKTALKRLVFSDIIPPLGLLLGSASLLITPHIASGLILLLTLLSTRFRPAKATTAWQQENAPTSASPSILRLSIALLISAAYIIALHHPAISIPPSLQALAHSGLPLWCLALIFPSYRAILIPVLFRWKVPASCILIALYGYSLSQALNSIGATATYGTAPLYLILLALSLLAGRLMLSILLLKTSKLKVPVTLSLIGLSLAAAVPYLPQQSVLSLQGYNYSIAALSLCLATLLSAPLIPLSIGCLSKNLPSPQHQKMAIILVPLILGLALWLSY